jgi:hypothetical protein
MTSNTRIRPALRVDPSNQNHHLWCNNGTWWIHYTLHLPDYTIRRVRESLRTRDVVIARHRRDRAIAGLYAEWGAA